MIPKSYTEKSTEFFTKKTTYYKMTKFKINPKLPVNFFSVDSDEYSEKPQTVKHISNICDNGVWEVTTQSKNVETEYKVDPQSCDFTKISQEKENDPDAPADCSKLNSAVKTAEASNSKVTSAEYDDGGNIEVNTADHKGQENEVSVSSDGSKVISDKLDD